MDFEVKEHRPFGPVILEAKCPDFIVESLNDYIDNYDHDLMPFNLLSRNVKNPFIEHDFADEIGLTDFMNYLGQEYLDMVGRTKYGPIVEGKEYRYDVTLMDGKNSKELRSNGKNFIDAWVNIYEESDFTPIHTHGGDLASVMILQLPEDSDGQNEIVNDECDSNPHGQLNYYHAIGDSSDIMVDTWTPFNMLEWFYSSHQIFVMHIIHINLKGQERRSLSLNYTLEVN